MRELSAGVRGPAGSRIRGRPGGAPVLASRAEGTGPSPALAALERQKIPPRARGSVSGHVEATCVRARPRPTLRAGVAQPQPPPLTWPERARRRAAETARSDRPRSPEPGARRHAPPPRPPPRPPPAGACGRRFPPPRGDFKARHASKSEARLSFSGCPRCSRTRHWGSRGLDFRFHQNRPARAPRPPAGTAPSSATCGRPAAASSEPGTAPPLPLRGGGRAVTRGALPRSLSPLTAEHQAAGRSRYPQGRVPCSRTDTSREE